MAGPVPERVAESNAEEGASRHIDVTLSAEQYAQVQREATKRGMTLAGYIRQRVFDQVHDEERLAQRLAGVEERLIGEIDRRLRVAVELLTRMIDTRAVATEQKMPPDEQQRRSRVAGKMYAQWSAIARRDTDEEEPRG